MAAFMYNFIFFTEWQPESVPATPFVIGILGKDPFGRFLDDIVKGESVHGRNIEVRRYNTIPSQESPEILFVSRESANLVKNVLSGGKTEKMLLISDSPEFTENGGHVRFFTENQKIRFEINLEAVQAAKLKLSSKLLRLARLCCTE